MRHSARLFAIVATLLGIVTLAAACGSDSSSSSAKTGPKIIRVTFSGRSVTPNGELVQIPRGERVELEVSADASGELRVQSDPALRKDYGAGTTRISLGSFDTPGRIEVASDALRTTIVTLEIK